MKVHLVVDSSQTDVSIEIHAPNTSDEVINLMKSIEELIHKNDFVLTQDEEVKRLLAYKTVEAFISENNYVYAISETTKSRLKLKLYEIEELSRPHQFFRISKSELVNLYLIDYFEPDISTGYIVVMKQSGNRYRVSPKYFKLIQNYIMGGKSNE